MKEIDWSKAPEGATHFHPELNFISAHWVKPGFFCLLGFEREGWEQDFNPGSSLVLVNRPQAWSGEGLPPVGTVCEVDWCEEWHQCEIIAHFDQRCGRVAAFTVQTENLAKSLDAFGAEHFRPVRTPEQIAAKEREKEVDDLCAEIVALYGEPKMAEHYHELAIALHAKGYRKQVQP